MNSLRKIAETLAFLITIWIAGAFLGIPFLWFRIRGKVVWKHRERLAPHKGRGLLIVSNHPSLFETVLLPLIFFPECLVRPIRLVPWSTPDRANMGSKWYFRMLRYGHLIMIDRTPGTRARNAGALRAILSALRRRESVVLFAEGGRTFKRPERLKSPKGKHLGRISKSVEFLLLNAGCAIVPVWVEGADRALPPGKFIPSFGKGPVEIRIGKPVTEPVTAAEVERMLLALADE